jgi:hypothetical protein
MSKKYEEEQAELSGRIKLLKTELKKTAAKSLLPMLFLRLSGDIPTRRK